MKPPSATVCAAMVVTSAVSLLIGWHLAPQQNLSPDVGDATQLIASEKPPRARPSRIKSGVERKMDQIRAAESPVERLRATISLAMSLEPSEFGAWVEGDRFSARNGPELSIFRMIIFERWAREDPDGQIAWSVNNDYGQAGRAMNAYAKNDPERLIAHFRENPNHPGEFRHLAEVAKHHPALALERLRELHQAGLTSDQARRSRSVLLELSLESTALLEASLASLPDSIRGQAQSVIFGRKLEKDFKNEIGTLFSHPEGWEIFEENLYLLRGKIPEILATIPEMPDSWRNDLTRNPWDLLRGNGGKELLEADLSALGFSETEARRLREVSLRYLARSNPELVLKNITDTIRNRSEIEAAVSSLFSRGVGNDAQTARLIAEIPEAEVRAEAAAQWQALVAGRNSKNVSSPSEWLENLGRVENAGIQREVSNRFRDLDEAKVEEYRAGFSSLPPEAKAKTALAIAAAAANDNSTSALHGDAILYLAKTQTAEPRKLSESTAHYTMNLAVQDPVSAAEWVGTLPEGNTRTWAAKNLAAYWNQYDPPAVSEWMKNLSASERKEVSTHLKPRSR